MTGADVANVFMWVILFLALGGIGYAGWCVYNDWRMDRELKELREAEAGRTITEELEPKDAD